MKCLQDLKQPFTVTKRLDDRPVLDAVRDIVGFYPMSISVGDSIIAVECVNKAERRLIGQLIDENNNPVVFANIQLLSIADTTFITGGVSNENGVHQRVAQLSRLSHS